MNDSLRKAAIFDLDGTLIPHTSAEKTFFFHLLRRGGLTPFNLLQMGVALWTAKFNLHKMIRGNKRYLRNKKVEKLTQVANTYFEPRIDRMVFPMMKDVIEEHREKGHVLLLLTGTLDIVAKCFYRKLDLDGYQAATLETRDGRYTGRIDGILPYGVGKLEVIRRLRHRFNFDQNHTFLYANIYSDRFVMNAVETPVAVNPDKRLRSYANKHGWEVIDPKPHMIDKIRKSRKTYSVSW
ncbi:MAG: HAD family hydrolase [Chitinivibrionales bacterium]